MVALRLYTTAAYVLINNPLRTIGAAGGEPHPLPVTVAYITDGISRLRATYANLPDASSKIDFWRGSRNLSLPESFRTDGGTEYAPLSTSANLQVALNYSSSNDRVFAKERLLFKVATAGFMDRGANLKYLSAFPNEEEFLYPPFTYLQPTGREEAFEAAGGINYTVVEVVPKH